MNALRILLLLAVALPASAQSFPTDSAVLAIIRQRVEEGRSKGIVVGLVESGGRTRVVAFGDPGPGKPPLDGNTVFEIGSISKVFTSTVLAQMVLAGQVTLDDPAQKYLPASVKLPTRNGKQITLGSLSIQNSGLPRMPTNFTPKDPTNPYADYSVQQMYDFLSGLTLTRDPGERFEYSNLGVGLLGHVLSLASGKSYEQLEQERVWTPLGMTRTAITLTPWMQEHLALGHDDAGKVVSNWDIPTFAGAGAIRSTTTDMLRFVAANLQTDRGPLGKAMAFALKAEILSPYVGVYELTPEFAIEITLTDGALFAQATGQGAFRLWPESESAFFVKEVDAQVTFVRDALGAVTSLVLHQGGQTVPGRKVK